jgi:hypothetical protein
MRIAFRESGEKARGIWSAKLSTAGVNRFARSRAPFFRLTPSVRARLGSLHSAARMNRVTPHLNLLAAGLGASSRPQPRRVERTASDLFAREGHYV